MRASGTSVARACAATASISCDAVVDEKDLTLAQQLPADRLGDGAVVLLADVGEDRLARGRGRVDDREVADPGEAHLQGPRDRVRGEGQHVDADRELLHRLFVADAEALLLVDDQQAEVA